MLAAGEELASPDLFGRRIGSIGSAWTMPGLRAVLRKSSASGGARSRCRTWPAAVFGLAASSDRSGFWSGAAIDDLLGFRRPAPAKGAETVRGEVASHRDA